MTELPRSPAFFLLAHHDDELFIAVTMKAMAALGPVNAAWLTRGGILGSRRQAETQAAMTLLGIPRENTFCFGLPDSRSLDYLAEIVVRLKALFTRLRPASVFVPAFEGGHLDHDTAQLAAAAALELVDWQVNQQPVLYEFPLYHRQNRLLAVGRFLPDDSPRLKTPLKLRDRLLKQKLTRVYASQRLILYPLLALRGGPMMLHQGGEPYRRVPAGRSYGGRPHPGRLAYEFYSRRRFGEFARAAEAVL